MDKKCQPAESSVGARRLWLRIGLRLQNRRVQMGFTEAAVAAYVGIPFASYQAFEAGQMETPAELLAQLADLFEVSLFHFFQDLPFGEFEPKPLPSEPAAVFTVATEEDRVAALVSDFSKLSRKRQQYLLLLARVLAEDPRDE
jgi:transcriptional regulator with XRE-family HTH domain